MTSNCMSKELGSELAMSAHAAKRCQQRGIPPMVVKWLLDFGEEIHSSGAEIYRFSRAGRRAFRRYAGRRVMSSLNRYMNCYLVLEDGVIITVGHRYRPIRKN